MGIGVEVSEAEYQRMLRDLDDVVIRLREIEAGRVPVYIERFRNQDDRIKDVKADVEDLKADQKQSRNMVRSALITATLSIVVTLLSAVVLFALFGR